jgi:hypothetical protein
MTVSAERRSLWEDRGYLIVRGLFAADVDALRAEADRLLARTDLISTNNMRCRWLPHAETGEYLFECFDPVVDLSPLFLHYSTDRRLLDVLADLYGDEACLMHDQLIYKPPGCGGYGLHQDYMAWPGYPRSFLTTSIALDRADADNGCIEVFPGLHRLGHLAPPGEDYHETPAEAVAGAEKVDLALDRGDVAIFGCFLPHRSGPNRSDRWRRHLFLCYNAQGDGGDRRHEHYDYYHEWKRRKYAAHGVIAVEFR